MILMIESDARAVILLPYDDDCMPNEPQLLQWIVSAGEEIPSDPLSFMMNLLYESKGYGMTRDEWDIWCRNGGIKVGEPVVTFLPGYDGKLVARYDPEHDQEEMCKCGHPYRRHFDSYEDNAPVGCKYCLCTEFEPDPVGEKHPTRVCLECHAMVDPDGKTCAKCGREVEVWDPAWRGVRPEIKQEEGREDE
jgi:hypothetical protein